MEVSGQPEALSSEGLKGGHCSCRLQRIANRSQHWPRVTLHPSYCAGQVLTSLGVVSCKLWATNHVMSHSKPGLR